MPFTLFTVPCSGISAWEDFMELITSRSNPLLVHIRKLLKSRSYRRETGQCVSDGIKLLEEAIRWKADLTAVLVTQETDFPPLPPGVRCVQVPRDVMASLSPMKAPQGALFTFRIPDITPPPALTGQRYLVLDGLQDPGNVGTIWRTVDAFAGDGLLLTGSCADPFSWKAIRASMGAAFRTPVWEITPQALGDLARHSALPLLATALRADTIYLQDLNAERAAVIIGSEGHGISPQMLALCQETIRIPMTPQCESLNAGAAAAVVLWELYRKQFKA